MTTATAGSVTTGVLSPGWKLRVLGAAVATASHEGQHLETMTANYLGPYSVPADYMVTAGAADIDILPEASGENMPLYWNADGTAAVHPGTGADVALGTGPKGDKGDKGDTGTTGAAGAAGLFSSKLAFIDPATGTAGDLLTALIAAGLMNAS